MWWKIVPIEVILQITQQIFFTTERTVCRIITGPEDRIGYNIIVTTKFKYNRIRDSDGIDDEMIRNISRIRRRLILCSSAIKINIPNTQFVTQFGVGLPFETYLLNAIHLEY